MGVIVSMLRGVNLGPHRRISMDALRAVYESLGLKDPRTYVQSGNVVFRTRDKDLGKLTRKIEKGIEEKFGFHSDVVLRSSAELRDTIARNPFDGRPEVVPAKLLVTFLASDPGEEARAKIAAVRTGADELRMDRREIYVFFPDGMGKSKLSWPAIDRALKTSWTGRNWNSVNKLLEMAVTMEAEGQ
jgi:uncharacterized protein (DUF1697 family)